MPDWTKVADKLPEFLKKDWKLKLIVLLGLAGMALILLSQFAQPGQSAPAALEQTEEGGSQQYIDQMEEKLTGLLADIQGVGRVRVMLTLENSGQYVYAVEEKRSVDRTTDSGSGEEESRVAQKENVEQKYILVETSYGQKQPLVETQLQPKIQGVVIACEGAGDILVEQRLINVVTTALGISSTRVCVVEIS